MVSGDAGLLSHRVVLLVTVFVLLAGGAAVERLHEIGAWLGSGILEGGSVRAWLCRLVATTLFVTLVVRSLVHLLRTGVLIRRWLGLAAWVAVPAVHWGGAAWYEVMPLEALVNVQLGRGPDAGTIGVSLIGLALVLFHFQWVFRRPPKTGVSPGDPAGS